MQKIFLKDQKQQTIDMKSAILNFNQLYGFHFYNCNNITLKNVIINSSINSIFLQNCNNITIDNIYIANHDKRSIILSNSNKCLIQNCTISNGYGGILLIGNSKQNVIRNNNISKNYGSSNWYAGICICDRNVSVENLMNIDNFWVKEEKIEMRINGPQENLILSNNIVGNKSSGIYCDGANTTLIIDNYISQNSKEGICLDYGSIGNFLLSNTIILNGKRYGLTDDTLSMSFILNFGRLSDGSAAAKLPGISLDNTIFNKLISNTISSNFGSGIKIVRTGFYNLIETNTIWKNNLGVSSKFHFFGIELGFAQADVVSDEMDFLGSHGNIICRNSIDQNHYAGLFIANNCSFNHCFDNSIMNNTTWCIESLEINDSNTFVNNVCVMPSRNIKCFYWFYGFNNPLIYYL